MTDQVSIFDKTPCLLGEGPLWHPERRELFWFDILNKKLLTRAQNWTFDEHVSAAGWVDQNTLLIASETGLYLFDLDSFETTLVAPLEAENPKTRSNDGRADPSGGFWIGTMGHNAEEGAGGLYRFYRGELRQLREGVTIPNATCFSPDGSRAYFADTKERLVWRYMLDDDGWPLPNPEVFLDHTETECNPDGAVIDAEGRFWCAEWGASRVACYDPSGSFVSAIELPVPQPTCPAFGNGGLYITTARQGLPDQDEVDGTLSGQTFLARVDAKGQVENRVLL